MSAYTILWEPDALDAAADLWIRSTNRAAVARACDAAERLLKTDPASQGVDLREGLRKLDVKPVRFVFSVQEADRIVLLHAVKQA